MGATSEVYKRLGILQARLEQLNLAWTHTDHENLVKFLVDYLPKMLNAQRCSIFLFDPDSEKIWVKYGTGIVEKQIEAPRKGSFVGRTISSGIPIIKNDLDKEDGFHSLTDQETHFATLNMICSPIDSLVGNECVGAIQVLNKYDAGGFDDADDLFLKRIIKYLSFALENARLNREIISISNRLYHDIETLKQKQSADQRLVAKSPNMQKLVDTVRKVSRYPINMHVCGESGSGKEVIARLIHDKSIFTSGAFVAVNCSSIPEHLMESEFFGHEKGAFTGAVGSRPGRFEEAENGTLFLDEVGDMPLSIQPKFLRAIQEMEGIRIGSNMVRKYNFRIISASGKSLRKEVDAKRFREDLLFRLFALEVHIPPLRERKEDIIPLAMLFLDDTCRRFQKKVSGFSKPVLEYFEKHLWPGNVRQLQREVERLVALTPDGCQMRLSDCSADPQRQETTPCAGETNFLPGMNLTENKNHLEKNLIIKALGQTNGSKAQAAKLLGITRQGLHYKIKAYDIHHCISK
jgi:transcriptional regulator with GAF, ATPase, and Fis domain